MTDQQIFECGLGLGTAHRGITQAIDAARAAGRPRLVEKFEALKKDLVECMAAAHEQMHRDAENRP